MTRPLRNVLMFALPLMLLASIAATAGTPSPLDRLKALEGTWTGTAGHGDGNNATTVTYHVTAGGSAVVETLFPGTPHEMVTVYTVDAGTVVLTHYCAAGNQPHMRARKGANDKELVFEFAGGAGIHPAKDTHMHSARMVFVDADHLRNEWTSWEGGKPTEPGVFELTRAH